MNELKSLLLIIIKCFSIMVSYVDNWISSELLFDDELMSLDLILISKIKFFLIKLIYYYID